MDYRDQLEALFRELHDRDGLTRYRLSKLAGISEQRISKLLLKRTNLSPNSLQCVLARLGYELRFEPNPTDVSTETVRRSKFTKM